MFIEYYDLLKQYIKNAAIRDTIILMVSVVGNI